ncbi:MAG: tetratricopeptide repeat protein [Planctomycetota bacterium]|nr:tetratricopeptide repeat protein [Planctomycetota bacterium]
MRMRRNARTIGLVLWAVASQCCAGPDYDALNEKAKAAFEDERYEKAEALFEKALAASEKLPDDDVRRAAAQNNMAQFYRAFEREDLAVPYLRAGIEWLVAHRAPDDPELDKAWTNMAPAYRRLGDLEREREAWKNALVVREAIHGPRSAPVADVLNNLAVAEFGLGRFAEARTVLETAIDIWQTEVLADHPNIAAALQNLAMIDIAEEDPDGAIESYLRARAVLQRSVGDEHPAIARLWRQIGNAHRMKGDDLAAVDAFRESLRRFRGSLGDEHLETARTANSLAVALRATGDLDGAREWYDRALPVMEKELGADHRDVGAIRFNIASLLAADGRDEDAETLYREALAVLEDSYGASHPALAAFLEPWADFLDRRNLTEEAATVRERVAALVPIDENEDG